MKYTFVLIIYLSTFSLNYSQITWELVYPANMIESLLNLHCIDSNNCFCLSDHERTRLLRSTDGGRNWFIAFDEKLNPFGQTIPFPLTPFNMSYPSKNHVYITYEKGVLIRSKDNYVTHDTVFLKPKKANSKYEYDIRFLYMKDSLYGLAGYWGGIYITKDGWDTYDELPKLDEFKPDGYETIFGLPYGSQIYLIDSLNYVLFVSYTKQVSNNEWIRKTGIVKTSDGGVNWNFFQLCDQKSVSDYKASIKEFSFINDKVGWAIGFDRDNRSILLKTNDGGLNWEEKYKDPVGVSSEYLKIKFSDDNNGIIVGKFAEIRVTYDGGETWINETKADYDTRMSRIVQHIAFAGKTPILSTYADGIWRGTYPTTSVDDINGNGASISPNPASDFITIQFQTSEVSKTSEVSSVQIFDMLGIEIKDLTPALSEGEGVRIDVSHLAAGVYFIRIGDKVEKFVKM